MPHAGYRDETQGPCSFRGEMGDEVPAVVSLKKTGRGLMSLLGLHKGSPVTRRERPEGISDGCDTVMTEGHGAVS